METRHGSLVARTIEKDLEVTNGRVMLRLVLRDGGYAQEWHAVGPDGKPHLLLSSIHKNLVAFSHHRACASPMISGDRMHMFGVCRESLRMVYSEVKIAEHDDDHIRVRLTGLVQGHSMVCEITLETDSDTARVAVEDEIAASGSDPVLEYLMSSYAFLPNGAMISEPADLDFAWAPMLRPANDHVIGDSAFHSPAVILQHGPLAAALVPDVARLKENRPMPAALDLDLDNGLLPAPLISYGFCGYEPADGGRCHGHDLTMCRRLGDHKLGYAYHILLDANCKKGQAHSRVARFLWEKRDILAPRPLAVCWKPTDLPVVDAADGGPIPPAFFDDEAGQWRGCRFEVDGSRYSSAESSALLYRRLRRARYSGGDDGLLTRCREYASFLMETRLRSGAIPTWFAEDLTPISALRSCAQTAISALFMFELARALGTQSHATAAERSARFVLKEIVPKALYQDVSCYDPERQRTLECPDPHTGLRPQSGWAVLWTAQALLAAHEYTGDRAYLSGGLIAMDRLCLLQVTAEMPWRAEAPVGSLVSGNVGAWVDMELTAEFGICAMRFGATTGRREYFDRGTAALWAAQSRAGSSEAVRDSISAAVAEFGDVFVHLAGKWASGARMDHAARGTIVLKIDQTILAASPNAVKVVFAGAKGSSYKLHVNGHHLTASREEMERGISLRMPQEAARTERPPAAQGSLFSSRPPSPQPSPAPWGERE